MTTEEKELLFSDLCARLFYGIKLFNNNFTVPLSEFSPLPKETPIDLFKRLVNDGWVPYLRPMSSMTEEEKDTYDTMVMCNTSWVVNDWLNAHHFDYRRLIEKGLALEAPKDMYKTSEL